MCARSGDAMQRYLERQARGRNQRLAERPRDIGKEERMVACDWNRDLDCFDVMLESYQKKVAQNMLEDFHTSGVDEDLEALKAGWASHFKTRPGQPQPRRPLLADLTGREEESSEEEPRSVLAAQGERAKQRLKGLSQLRKLASDGQIGEALAICPPLEQLCRFPGAKAQAGERDSWAAWECRWNQEFQRFEEMERLRQRRLAEEARATREEREEWHRHVHASKARNRDCKSKAERPRPDRPDRPDRPAPAPAPAPAAPAAPRFPSFQDFVLAWGAFEQKLQGTSPALRCSDIPWPDSLPSVSGTTSSDKPADAKKKLRTALLRWHPDKWAPILERVVEADRSEVLARVKQVTQRLLEEKTSQTKV